MTEAREYSDPQLEKHTLSALLGSKGDELNHFNQIPVNYFTDESLRVIYGIVRELVREVGAVPALEAVRIQSQTKYPRSPEVVEGILRGYSQLLASKPPATLTFLTEKLRLFARARDMLSGIEHSLRLLREGDIEAALKNYEEDALALQLSDSSLSIKRGEVIADFDKRYALTEDMALHPEKYRGIMTGIDELDMLTGGLWKGELGFVFGRTGVGKSFFLLEVAFNAFLSGYKVLVIPIEMPLIQWERRLDARISHIDYSLFKHAQLSSSQKEQWKKRFGQMLKYTAAGAGIYVTHIPLGCTMSAVRAELEQFIRKGTPIDMVVIDYADLLVPPRTLASEQAELTNIFRELKGIAETYYIPVWTATQARRDSYAAPKVDLSDVGYAASKAHISDLVLGLTRTDADELRGVMQLWVAKHRDGTLGKSITLKPNLALSMINQTGV